MTRAALSRTNDLIQQHVRATQESSKATILEMESANAWIALALCTNKSIASGPHRCCAVTVCTGKHFRRLVTDSDLTAEELFELAKRPRGFRDRLYDKHPVVTAMRTRMKTLRIRKTSDVLLTPRSRKQIRPYLAARFPFLFDASLSDDQKCRFKQSDLVADTCRHVIGWEFDDIVELFEWAWDNKRSGGAGQGSFARLWTRDLEGFLLLYRSGKHALVCMNKQAESGLVRRTKKKFDTMLPILEAVISDVFELERIVDCLEALASLRSQRQRMSLLQKSLSGGCLSPLQIFIVKDDPKILQEGNKVQQSYVASHISAKARLKSRPLSSDKDMTEAYFVGWDDLDYALHAIIGISRKRNSLFRRYKTPEETSMLQSRSFRLALNLVATVDPERAKQHLVKRLGEEKRAKFQAKVTSTDTKNLSYFELLIGFIGIDGLCNINSSGSVPVEQRNFFESERPGSSYVTEFKNHMSILLRRGLHNASTNSARRAIYYRESWVTSPIGTALRRARKNQKTELAKLDEKYVSALDESRLLETSLVLAEYILECVLPPLTNRDFAISLPENPKKVKKGRCK